MRINKKLFRIEDIPTGTKVLFRDAEEGVIYQERYNSYVLTNNPFYNGTMPDDDKWRNYDYAFSWAINNESIIKDSEIKVIK